jgi:lipopolysaccharide/colanic/teichoic acid biosynthesis glycosyltransferase
MRERGQLRADGPVGSEQVTVYADDTPQAVRLRGQGIELGEPAGSGVSTNGSDADWSKGTHAGTWRASDSVGNVAPTAITPSSGRSRQAGRVLRFAVKRTIDVAGATLALLALLPLMLAIAVAILLESRGPVFYRGERLGPGGRRLRMLKFRKMHEGASGQALTLDRDPRLTRVGAILARTRLDELPQFWHVLRGDMSLVGPRPEDPRFASLMRDEFRRILSVRPGMTGLSQLAFADERSILRREDAEAHYVSCLLPQKAALDGMYADGISIRRDLAILLATTVTVLLGLPIAVNRSTGALTLRRAPKGASAHVPERRGAAAALAVAEASVQPLAAFAHPAQPEIVDSESADRPPQRPFVERPACVDLE